jgi:hypothetical protein
MDGFLLEGQERSGTIVLRFLGLLGSSSQLFARRGTLPDATHDAWTTFEMTLREPTPIPPAFDFTRFLVSSITFMAHLSEVSVYLDDKRLARLTKDTAIPKQITIPRGLKTLSTQGLMKVKEIKITRKYDLEYSKIHRSTSYSSTIYQG